MRIIGKGKMATSFSVSSAEWKTVFHECTILLCKYTYLHGNSLLSILRFLSHNTEIHKSEPIFFPAGEAEVHDSM